MRNLVVVQSQLIDRLRVIIHRLVLL